MFKNVKHICENDKDIENVRKIINARATQLLNILVTNPLGNNADDNFARIQHEWRGLQLTHGDVDKYLHPQTYLVNVGNIADLGCYE